MNRTFTRQFLMACCWSLMSASALAGVTITSRLSNAMEFGQTIGYYPPPDEYYSNSATYTQMGTWSIVLPKGFSHTSNVSPDSVSGSFASSYSQYSSAYTSIDGYECSLEVLFSVTGGTAIAQIALDGSGTPAWHYATQPESLNAHVVVRNLDTNAIVFDSFNHGVYTFFPLFNPTSTIEWNTITARVRLSTGQYRLLVGAKNNDAWHPGPGVGWYANASLSVTMAFSCPSDFNADGFVDDADFTTFVVAYEVLLCDDPAMPVGCPADLNGDGFVDDVDFQMFGQAYDQLLCP